jgi:hypothetical protein
VRSHVLLTIMVHFRNQLRKGIPRLIQHCNKAHLILLIVGDEMYCKIVVMLHAFIEVLLKFK